MSAVFQGKQSLPFPAQQVWDALFDVDVLRASIAGCERLEQRGENAYSSQVRVAIGPVTASFATTLDVVDPVPPHRCTLKFSGKGGAVGFGRGEAHVILTSQGDSTTLLEWSASTQVGGKIAQMGARLIDGTVRKMSDEFFARFARQLAASRAAGFTGVVEAVAAPEAVPAPHPAERRRGLWLALAGAVVVVALWVLVSQGGGR